MYFSKHCESVYIYAILKVFQVAFSKISIIFSKCDLKTPSIWRIYIRFGEDSEEKGARGRPFPENGAPGLPLFRIFLNPYIYTPY